MKLFGKHKQDPEQEPEVLPNEEELEKAFQRPVSEATNAVAEEVTEAKEAASDTAERVEEIVSEAGDDAGKLVLDIEGLNETPVRELPTELRGATKTLPNKDTIAEAVKETLKEEDPGVLAAAAAETAAAEPVSETDPVKDPEPAAETKPEPEAAQSEAAPEEKAAPAEKPLSAVSYESVAEAMESAQKEPTGRFSRDAVDDDTLLAELYALIGDPGKAKATEAAKASEAPKARSFQPQRPVARLTPEALKDVPEEYEDVAEEDASGVPGWLKGLFILLISLLLGAMTFYAVASDVIGEIF